MMQSKSNDTPVGSTANTHNEGENTMEQINETRGTDKKRFDYASIGLVKEAGIVTFNGKGIKDLPIEAQDAMANYGLFVGITRTTARTSDMKLTVEEMKAEFQEYWNWLMAGCPKRAKADKVDQFTAACNKVMASEAPAGVKKSTIAGLEMVFSRKYETK